MKILKIAILLLTVAASAAHAQDVLTVKTISYELARSCRLIVQGI